MIPTPIRPVLLAGLLLAAACSDDSGGVDPELRLCGGEGAFGARVEGVSSTYELCTTDDDAGVFLTPDTWYDVTVSATRRDGVRVELELLFPHRNDAPTPLNPTANLAEAMADPMGAWVRYRETPSGGGTRLQSVTVSGGSFMLSYSDTRVLVGNFASLVVGLENKDTQDPAGSRTIAEGFFSLSVDQ